MNSTKEYATREETFFYDLLDRTANIFKEHSLTLKENPGSNWNFAICDTPIQKGEGLFFGLNWGGGDIDAQSMYPVKNKDRNWKFAYHAQTYCKEYFGKDIKDLNYSNLCFFRSPKIKSLHPKDWETAIPLFREYVNFVEPSWTLMIGKPHRLGDAWKQRKRIEVFDKTTNRRAFGYTGTLFGFPFGSVPYYTQAMSYEVRNEIWELVSTQVLNISETCKESNK